MTRNSSTETQFIAQQPNNAPASFHAQIVSNTPTFGVVQTTQTAQEDDVETIVNIPGTAQNLSPSPNKQSSQNTSLSVIQAADQRRASSGRQELELEKMLDCVKGEEIAFSIQLMSIMILVK